MTVEIIDGIRVIKLTDGGSNRLDAAQDMRALAYIHMLLGGAHGARDTTIYSRRMV
jgi:hypothetical protein